MTPRRLLALAVALGLAASWSPAPAVAFTGFGPMSADATYDEAMTFRVELPGGAPDRLELLLRLAGDDATLVAPVEPEGNAAEYVWDATRRYVTPNTRIAFRWRATDGGTVTLSEEQTLLYDDDRPGLDWTSARLGETTVHWYGGAESIALDLGQRSAEGVAAAEALLGHQLAGPVDIFVYASRDEFFGALGPGAREWTGAATYPAIRTIFMWIEAGDRSYLESTIVHEATHVVFNDATANPYHEPAKWINEGLASWSEGRTAAGERSIVESEAGSGAGLFAFEAITEQFPIGARGSSLAYAQGATMVDMIIAEHGAEAIAAMAAAYRDGASDAEALEAGTGRAAEELFAGFYAEFGVEPPQPVDPVPIPPSTVRKPGDGATGNGATASTAPGPDGAPADGRDTADGVGWLLVPAAALVVLVVGGLVWASRRRPSTGGMPPER